MKKIYFDHSATTPVDPQVLETMLPFFSNDFGNASSMHSFGQTAALAVDQARRAVASAFGSEPQEVIFTSGATEANNLAILGLLKGLQAQGFQDMQVVTTLVEHDAIIEPCRELVRSNLAQVTYLEVDNKGVVDLAKLEKSLTDKTVLVSVMFANSEVGAVEPIKEIGKLLKKIKEQRLAEWEKIRVSDRTAKPLPLYFHTDATQAVNFFDCNIKSLHVDMLSMSAHKIYGPKGVGALIVKDGVPVTAIQRGGHQEKNLRSGTLNVPGIVGLGKAVTLAVAEREKNNQYLLGLRNYLVEEVLKQIPQTVCNTDLERSTPSHAHFSFLGAEGEAILLALDMEAGIAVSTGSACASHTLKASRVLLAMGIKTEDTHGAIRFTLGKHNTKADIDELLKHLPLIVKRFRDMAPEY